MLSVIQESHRRIGEGAQRREVGCQWESPEEEETKEVGCQWESPEEEETKEVGCQSESVERRDAAVQVDLLTQQLCGVAWRCVSVRADEPGGGALLQHCSTHRTPSPPPDPEEPEAKLLLQQTVSSSSMHLCELTSADTSAPPPGLIAPLSPRLAEEEEEEEDEDELGEEEEDELGEEEEEDELGEEEGCLDPENNERFHGYRRLSTRTTEKKCQPRRSDGEKTLPDQSGERRQTRMRHQHCRRRRIQQHEEQEEEKEEEVTGKMKEEEEGVTPGKIKTDQAERPRRKAVGPPIRYLIEYEEKVHGLSAANHSKDRGAKVDRRRRREEEEEEPGRRGRVERRKKRESSLKESSVGGAKPLLKLHLSRLARSPALRVCRRHHFLNRGSCHGNRAAPADAGCADDRAEEVHAKIKENEEEEKPRLLAHPGAPYLARRRQRVHRNPRWCVDYLMLMSRRRWQENDVRRGRKRRRCREEELKQVSEEERGGEQGKRRRREERGDEDAEEWTEEVKEQPRRPRRTTVGPPIRYLLESEEQPHRPGGGALNDSEVIDRPEDTQLTERQTGDDRQTGLTKRRPGRPKKAGGGASEMAAERQTGQIKRERFKRRKRRRCREEEVQHICLREAGGETLEEESREPLQRPRRKMVGPPIRYLLESEERAPLTANQERAEGSLSNPQKNVNAEGGTLDDTAVIDRPDDTQLTERQTGLTNPDAGRPKKVVIDSEAGGGASGMTERQTGWRTGGRRRRKRRCREEEVKEQPHRPRRTMVGPPIRYLVQSEEQLHRAVRANQERAQSQSKTGGGALDDTVMIDRAELTERQTGETERQTGERQTGETERQTGETERQTGGTERQTGERQTGGTERQTGERQTGGTERQTGERQPGGTERQTGSYKQVHLLYFDPQSRQLTVFSPCCVRLKRLL